MFEELVSHFNGDRLGFARALLDYVVCVNADGENSTEARLKFAKLLHVYGGVLRNSTLTDIKHEASYWEDEIQRWISRQPNGGASTGTDG